MVQTSSINGRIYSVDMMLAYINIYKPAPKKIKIADYLHELEAKGWGDSVNSYSAMDVLQKPVFYQNDYERIQKADLKYPIIICGNEIMDGIHRLTKAYLQHKKEIKAYIFTDKLLAKFMIGTRRNYEKSDTLQTHDLIQLFYARFVKRK